MLADEQAQKDHEWNLKFCKAIEEKDEKTADEMVMERLPHIFEEAGFFLPEPEDMDKFAEDVLQHKVELAKQKQ